MTEMIQQIFDLCVVPLLGVVTTYVVKLINKKNKEIDNKVENENVRKYVDMLSEAIQKATISTSQTYVDALKQQNLFDSDAQKKAFQKTYNKVIQVLTDEAKECLQEIYGDLEAYITIKIEAEVRENKVEKKPEVKLEIKAEEKKTENCEENKVEKNSEEKAE